MTTSKRKDKIKPCCHCKKRLAWRSRGLCNICWRAVKDLYAPNKPYMGNACLPGILGPAPKTYPDTTKLIACPHNLRDGECPICEREQRRSLSLADSPESDD